MPSKLPSKYHSLEKAPGTCPGTLVPALTLHQFRKQRSCLPLGYKTSVSPHGNMCFLMELNSSGLLPCWTLIWEHVIKAHQISINQLVRTGTGSQPCVFNVSLTCHSGHFSHVRSFPGAQESLLSKETIAGDIYRTFHVRAVPFSLTEELCGGPITTSILQLRDR